VAGTIATVIVTLFAPFVADFAVKLGPPEYFLLMVLAFTTVSAVLGKSTLRGMTALFIGLAVGLVGLDQISGQARYTGGVPELLDGIEIVLVAVGLFAVAEVLYFGAVRRPRGRDQNKHEPRLHEQARLEAFDPGLAARHRHRHALRLHPGRRHRDPDLPELCGGEEAGQGRDKAEFGTGRHRGRGRSRGGQQRHRHGGDDPAADAGHPDRPTPRPSCWARSRTTASSPARSCSPPRPRWCGR
jgi:hypothetical protein